MYDGQSAFCLSCGCKSDGCPRSWPMLLNIDAEGRGVVCRGICGNVRHGKTCISAASMEGVCVSAMLFQSAREVAGGQRGF